MIIISAIGLLSTFLSAEAGTSGFDQAAYLQIAIHLVLAVSAVLLAYSDKLDKADYIIELSCLYRTGLVSWVNDTFGLPSGRKFASCR